MAKDPRVFINVNLEGKEIKGLLDFGSSVSILGNGCRELIQSLQIESKSLWTNVKTVSGQQPSVRKSKCINVSKCYILLYVHFA